MKTESYNPSNLEVEFANAIYELQEKIGICITNNEIIKLENNLESDNPTVKFFLLDSDGDPHEVVIKIIQVPDKF